ncbi:hypothetical protein RJ639_046447, partial [Escallonia herrerae]
PRSTAKLKSLEPSSLSKKFHSSRTRKTMSRKRDKPWYSRYAPYSQPKRRRPLPPPPLSPAEEDLPEVPPAVKVPTAAVLVTGLSPDCSVLDLKSRFEIYGAISRTRMDPGGAAHVTFRSKESADSAIAASRDPSFGITLNSKRVISLSLPPPPSPPNFAVKSTMNEVEVMWASDPVPQWREGLKQKDDSSSSSKLLRAEVPLRRHGRGNKLGSAIVNPKDNSTIISGVGSSLEVPFKSREIVAYDDLL